MPESNRWMVPFLDLSRQYALIKGEMDEALLRVGARGSYIMGSELEDFQQRFAAYCGCARAAGVASGTDAIALALKALNIGPGDEVITTPLTAVPTVMAIIQAGATPVFADIEEGGYGLDPAEAAKAAGPRTRALLPVHIFGECVEMDTLLDLAGRLGIALVEDACQAHGASWQGHPAGSLGAMGCFSFYPTKNLGAVGDAGMVTTGDESLYYRVCSLRDYGRSSRDTFSEPGWNSRLDEIQAAVLGVKLSHLDQWTARRKEIAGVYNQAFSGTDLFLPIERPGRGHVYHLYVVSCDYRDDLASMLSSRGVQTHVHYPAPVHLQPALMHLGYARGDFPRAEAASARVLSLPLNPWMTDAETELVANATRESL